MNGFTTSFGRTIAFVPGYCDAHARIYEELEAKGRAHATPGVTYASFVDDFAPYGMMIDFFADYGLPDRYGRALDVGGAEGTVSRLLKLEGRAAYAACVDLHPPERALTTAQAIRYYARYRVRAAAAKRLPGALGLAPKGRRNKYGYAPSRRSHVLNVRARRPPTLDDYRAGDFLDAATISGRFDLITAIQVICHFDYRAFFARAADLLNEGGVVYALVNYWWTPVNRTRIYGHFPYACQRLTRDDLCRYFDAHHPERSDWVRAAYDSFHPGAGPAVVNDLVEAAAGAQLSLVGVRRLGTPLLDRTSHTALTPHRLDASADTRLRDVLEDIHCFRADVTLEDLQTTYLAMAFIKRESAAGS